MKTITNKTARATLYAFHGGQYSQFYAAASSGLVENFYFLLKELEENVNSGLPDKYLIQLDKLKTWIKNQEQKDCRGYLEDRLNQTAYNFLPWAEGEPVLRVLNIDAWAESDPNSWTWNNWTNAGTIPAQAIKWTPKKLFKWFRENGYINPRTPGKISREDDEHNVTICDRKNGRPLYAIEYGPAYN